MQRKRDCCKGRASQSLLPGARTRGPRPRSSCPPLCSLHCPSITCGTFQPGFLGLFLFMPLVGRAPGSSRCWHPASNHGPLDTLCPGPSALLAAGKVLPLPGALLSPSPLLILSLIFIPLLGTSQGRTATPVPSGALDPSRDGPLP